MLKSVARDNEINKKNICDLDLNPGLEGLFSQKMDTAPRRDVMQCSIWTYEV